MSLSTDSIRYSIGLDISTQTITAVLIGVRESAPAENASARPVELMLSHQWSVSRRCSSEMERKSPRTWVALARECIGDLISSVPETVLAEAIGVSTTFPGVFPILKCADQSHGIDPDFVSLYDNTDDAGLCLGAADDLLSAAETASLNRVWPGNAAVGLAALVKNKGLQTRGIAVLAMPNTAFAWAMLVQAGFPPSPEALFSDFTQTAICGLYGVPQLDRMPESAARLLQFGASVDPEHIRGSLPRAEPSWRNVVPPHALQAVRDLFGLPRLRAVSIGAGDSPLGALALACDADTVVNIRGSSDSPMIHIDSPAPRQNSRETVLHYPQVTAAAPDASSWWMVAPMLRSGRVWDWVRNLRADCTDDGLETLAAEALVRRLTAPECSQMRRPVEFNTALGGERAPQWDPLASGAITGILESHGIGDIALAALEGMSLTLETCISLMESRSGAQPSRLLLAGGPTHNRLWNWVTSVFTGKQTFSTAFSDASPMGAALLGYGAAFDRLEPDAAISGRLQELSHLCSQHPLIKPTPVTPPNHALARLEEAYLAEAALRRSPV